jgi:hypothetical protein
MIPGLSANVSTSANSSASNKGEQTLHGDLGLSTGEGNRGFVNNVNFAPGDSIGADGLAPSSSNLLRWVAVGILVLAVAAALWFRYFRK